MYLLDSSAWLAHLLGESGMEEVTALFAKEERAISISALSLPEVYTQLKALEQEARWSMVWATYQPCLAKFLPLMSQLRRLRSVSASQHRNGCRRLIA